LQQLPFCIKALFMVRCSAGARLPTLLGGDFVSPEKRLCLTDSMIDGPG
jgi:hypothetical protein